MFDDVLKLKQHNIVLFFSDLIIHDDTKHFNQWIKLFTNIYDQRINLLSSKSLHTICTKKMD